MFLVLIHGVKDVPGFVTLSFELKSLILGVERLVIWFESLVLGVKSLVFKFESLVLGVKSLVLLG